MTAVELQIADNLERIRDKISKACLRAGRNPTTVQLVAVTKYAEMDWVHALVKLGVANLGESRPQQLVERATELPPSVCWHLIGHLQRNKVRPVLPVTTMIHSVDTLRLLNRIDALAGELGMTPRLLLEVNLAGEASKDGFSTDGLLRDWDAVCKQSHVEIAGLMTMAPHTGSEDDARRVFRELRHLRDRLTPLAAGRVKLSELSMGMSGDFEAAIEEGATIIRVGSLLFNGLNGTKHT